MPENKYILDAANVSAEIASFIGRVWEGKATVIVDLMYYLRYTVPMLKQHGAILLTSEAEDTIDGKQYRVIFPPGTVKEEQVTQLSHVRTFLLTLPDGSVFHELYHLSFNQSILSPPFDQYPRIKHDKCC